MSALSGFQKGLRRFVKRFIYSQLYLREALFLMFGKTKPFVRFTVEADPPSLYFNFAIRPEQLAEFERELDLPYPLTPIRCVEGDEPFHCLTLNVYRVSGLANGIRAEWSVYVRDRSDKPRYLIVEAAADAGSMDPIDIITRACDVSYARTDQQLTCGIASKQGGRFEARVEIPADAPLVRAEPEWVEANDLIYWRNGVCDRTFYDAGLANAKTRLIPTAKASVEDSSRWGRIVDPTPRHVIVFENSIDFAMSPWWNIDEL